MLPLFSLVHFVVGFLCWFVVVFCLFGFLFWVFWEGGWGFLFVFCFVCLFV